LSSLSTVLLAAFPHVPHVGRHVMQTLAESRGRIGGADFVAARVGLRNRHQLARALRRDGLPQFEQLCAWICVMEWIAEWEHGQISLFKLASSTDLAPPTCYRMVKRLTGVTWTEARQRGLAWVLSEFSHSCPALVYRPSQAEQSRSSDAGG
jgi:hypothetical protein